MGKLRTVVVGMMLSGVLAAQPDESIVHRVQSGDTLGTLSRVYGWAPEELRAFNPGVRVEDANSFRIPLNKDRWARHKIRQGDTFAVVAEGYGIPVQELRGANASVTEPLVPDSHLLLPRVQKPEWRVVRRVAIQASRSGASLVQNQRSTVAKPAGQWVKVTTLDGRSGWVRVNDLNYRETDRSSTPNTSMLFGRKLSADQKQAVLAVVQSLEAQGFRVNADDICTFMALETGGTFDPSIRSSSGAVGLAQFTDIAITDLNSRRPPQDQLSKDRLAKMSFQEQSLVVAEYLSHVLAVRKMKGREVTGHDLYAAIFCPRAVGQAENYVVYGKADHGGYYHRNASLDHDKDGVITKAEMAWRFTDWAGRGEKLRD